MVIKRQIERVVEEVIVCLIGGFSLLEYDSGRLRITTNTSDFDSVHELGTVYLITRASLKLLLKELSVPHAVVQRALNTNIYRLILGWYASHASILDFAQDVFGFPYVEVV